MPKQVNFIPNLRVDIPDFKTQGQEFSTDLSKLGFERWVQKHFAVVTEGFRVEIANQITDPGLFTVINGLALGRDGQIINNEENINAKRSFVLTTNATFFIEIEFITDFTDVESRAFWDPTFDNGSDPSGDLIPDGREFSQNISTRLFPDWKIVQPISTTGFERDTNANSLRVPVAVLTRSGGVITGGGTTPARTNLAQAITGGATLLRCLDTRHFPSAFTLRINPGGSPTETAAVTANDRENGILTLSLGTTNGFAVGTRLANENVTPIQLLDERTTPTLPTSGTEDARPRFFQADEERGFALTQDPYNDPGKSDLEIKALKDHVDAIAAELRELKFGASKASDVGDIAPPNTFGAVPRWFDRAGGVLGARTNTVSVGNGSTNFGDFNITTSGSAQAAIQAAIDAAPAGGIVYIKAGTYSLTTDTVTVNKKIWLIGDGQDQTIIEATGAAAALTLNATDIRLDRLSATLNGATATHAVVCTQMVGSAHECTFHGWSSASLSGSLFERCVFEAQNISPGTALTGSIINCVFRRCTFDSLFDNVLAHNLEITAGNDNKFDSCVFGINRSAITSQTIAVELQNGVLNTKFNDCLWQETNGGGVALSTSATVTGVTLLGCTVTLDNGVGTFADTNEIKILNTKVTFDQNQAGVSFNVCTNVNILNSEFNQSATAGAAGTGRGIDFIEATSAKVSHCVVNDADIGIQFNDLTDSSINECQILNPTGGRGRIGISGQGTVPVALRVLITNCHFSNQRLASATEHIGISIQSTAGTVQGVIIKGCCFSGIGDATTTSAFGIKIDIGSSVVTRTIISDCDISFINSTTSSIGIFIDNAQHVSILNNVFSNIGTNANGWFGVQIPDPNYININDNNFRTLGNVSASTAGSSAVSVGSSLAAAQPIGANINSNQFSNLLGSNTHFGIHLNNALEFANINNNVFEVSTTVTSAIIFEVTVVGGFDIQGININGNMIEGSINAIRFGSSEVTSLQVGHISISNNVIRDWAGDAIEIFGNASVSAENQHLSFNVTGNNLESTRNAIDGIFIIDCTNIAISSNVINLTSATGPSNGITSKSFESWNGNVIGNQVRVNATTGNGVDLEDCTDFLVVGNRITMSNGTNTGIALRTHNATFAAGNYLKNTNAAATQLSSLGTAENRARSSTDNNTGTDPGAFNAIDLNYRTQ